MALPHPHRTPLRRAAVAVAFGALLVGAAPAHAATAKPSPSITSVRPMRIAVGDTLELRGRNFLRGRGRNTVVFQRDGAKAVFVKASIGTRRLIKVTVPERLAKSLITKDGAPAATRFHLRVLAARFGRRFTTDAGSPTIGPKAAAAPGDGSGSGTGPGAPPALASPQGDCDGDGVLNGNQADDDSDLLDDATELRYKLDPCKADTDGDGVTDGYELQSARDLNDDGYQTPNAYLPYPGKRPYPNPLDGKDAGKDFDGDALTLEEEFDLWKTFGDRSAGLSALNYSDGKQCSVPGLAAAGYAKQADFLAWANANGYSRVFYDGGAADPHPAGYYDLRDVNHDGAVSGDEADNLDIDGDGLLCDNERDEDADGLTNYDESHGRSTPTFWLKRYEEEKPYLLEYAGTSLSDADSDGDGVRDGADDQDHDDISNLAELSRVAATGDVPGGIAPRVRQSKGAPGDPAQPQGRVNPFNPCLPNRTSRTCLRHPPFGDDAPAPFDQSPVYNVLN